MYVSGNQNLGWAGSRLSVHPDPTQKDTVYFGSRQQGLWRNDGDEWYRINGIGPQ